MTWRESSRFADRLEAGRALAAAVAARHPRDPVVLALPRGGVPVAAEVARALDAPLDLLIVRKIGTPWQPELAAAAIVDGDPPDLVLDEEVCASGGIDRHWIDAQAAREQRELDRRRQVYLRGRAPLPLAGKTAIVVDDGIATGTTVRAALKALRRRQPARLVLAVPVAPADTLALLAREVDEVVCLRTPEPFHAIGLHYEDFHQLADDEVLRAMDEADARRRRHEARAGDDAHRPTARSGLDGAGGTEGVHPGAAAGTGTQAGLNSASRRREPPA